MKKYFNRFFVVSVIVLMMTILVGCANKNGSVVGVGETLNAKNSKVNISLKVLSSLEKYTIKESFLYKGDTYARLQVELENKDKASLDNFGLMISFTLVDENKASLATSDWLLSSDDADNIYGKSAASGSKITGYLYFSEDNNDYDSNSKISDTTINNAKYLKVSIINSSKAYDDYYIELK